jgi:hypothetical protein
MLIAFLGKKSSGKDTSGDYLVQNMGFKKYVFANPLKKGIQAFFNLSDQQLYDEQLKETIDPRWGVSPRQLFQVIGTDIFQNSIHNFLPQLKGEFRCHWVTLFKEWYDQEIKKDPNTKIVITDARFLHEIEMIKKLGGKVVKVVRNSSYNGKGLDNHLSETEIEIIQGDMIDFIIHNDADLESLYAKIILLPELKLI